MLNFSEADGGSSERRLLNDLLQFYNSLERLVLIICIISRIHDQFRPVFNESDAVELQLGLTLQQIIDVVRFVFVVLLFCWENITLGDIIGGIVIISSFCFRYDMLQMILTIWELISLSWDFTGRGGICCFLQRRDFRFSLFLFNEKFYSCSI